MYLAYSAPTKPATTRHWRSAMGAIITTSSVIVSISVIVGGVASTTVRTTARSKEQKVHTHRDLLNRHKSIESN